VTLRQRHNGIKERRRNRRVAPLQPGIETGGICVSGFS
jgi:hypothetical protein